MIRAIAVISLIVAFFGCAMPPNPQPMPIPAPSSQPAQPSQPQLGNVVVNDKVGQLKQTLAQRRYLLRAATYSYDLPAIVGHVLYITPDSKGACPSSLLDNYDAGNLSSDSMLKQNTNLSVTGANTVLLSSKIDHQAAADIQYLVIGAKTDADLLSEVTITDTAKLNIPPNSLRDNWQSSLNWKNHDCGAVLIQGALVTWAYSKDYRKISTDAKVNAAVVAANGSYFQEEGTIVTEPLIEIDITQIPRSDRSAAFGTILTRPVGFGLDQQSSPPPPTVVPKAIVVPPGGFPLREPLPESVAIPVEAPSPAPMTSTTETHTARHRRLRKQ